MCCYKDDKQVEDHLDEVYPVMNDALLAKFYPDFSQRLTQYSTQRLNQAYTAKAIKLFYTEGDFKKQLDHL